MIRLSRRTALRGLAGASIALPWLEALAPRPAHAAGPKRFIVWFTPNGTIRDAWVPRGSETSFELSRILAPLSPFQKDLVVLDGVNMRQASTGPGDGHTKGMCNMLTGRISLPSAQRSDWARGASGPTVDQEIVAKLAPKTRFPSLQLGVESGRGTGAYVTTSYLGGDRPLPNEDRPDRVFTRLFGGGGAGDAEAVRRLAAERRSVLDAVGRTYQGLGPRLSPADRQRLDAHLTELRGLEQRLVPPSMDARPTNTCGATAPGTGLSFEATGKAMMDLIAFALGCDLTRVVSLQWTRSTSGYVFSFLGARRSHHDLSHSDRTADAREQLIKINTWYSAQLAYLLGKLRARTEGSGTLLDSTLVMTTNELADGGAHNQFQMPYVLAGRAGGALRTGRFLRSTGNTNQLLNSVLNAFGVESRGFGDARFGSGPLPGLL
jgi:hypothetical protein